MAGQRHATRLYTCASFNPMYVIVKFPQNSSAGILFGLESISLPAGNPHRMRRSSERERVFNTWAFLPRYRVTDQVETCDKLPLLGSQQRGPESQGKEHVSWRIAS